MLYNSNSIDPRDHTIRQLTTYYTSQAQVHQHVMEVFRYFPFLDPKPGQDKTLLLEGTVQAVHQGKVYNYPLSVSIPRNYPQNGCLCFISRKQLLECNMVLASNVHYLSEGGVIKTTPTYPVLNALRNAIESFGSSPPVYAKPSGASNISNPPPHMYPSQQSQSSLSHNSQNPYQQQQQQQQQQHNNSSPPHFQPPNTSNFPPSFNPYYSENNKDHNSNSHNNNDNNTNISNNNNNTNSASNNDGNFGNVNDSSGVGDDDWHAALIKSLKEEVTVDLIKLCSKQRHDAEKELLDYQEKGSAILQDIDRLDTEISNYTRKNEELLKEEANLQHQIDAANSWLTKNEHFLAKKPEDMLPTDPLDCQILEYSASVDAYDDTLHLVSQCGESAENIMQLAGDLARKRFEATTKLRKAMNMKNQKENFVAVVH